MDPEHCKKQNPHLGCRIDGKLKLRLFPVVNGEALHEEGGEPWPGASPEGVEDKETLEPGALVSQLPDAVQDQINHLLACIKTIIYNFTP